MSEIPSFEDWEKSHREADRTRTLRESVAEQERAQKEVEEMERIKALFDKTRQVAPYLAESLTSTAVQPNIRVLDKEEVTESAGGISGLFGATKNRLQDVTVGEGWLLYGYVAGYTGSGYGPDSVEAGILFRSGEVGYLKGEAKRGGRYSDTKTTLYYGEELRISARDDAFFEVDISQPYSSRLEVIDSGVKSYTVSEDTKDWRNRENQTYSEELVMEGLSVLAFRHGVSMKGL